MSGVVSEHAGLGQRAECKPIKDHGTAGRHPGYHRQGVRALRHAREREVAAYVDDIHLPTQLPKLLDDAPVEDITAGRHSEIARHGEGNAQFIRW
jgi:hypothetical protein